MPSLASWLAEAPGAAAFESYAYSYPHKTAYRRLEPAVALAEAWAAQDTRSLSLYLHVPFCEMRCGFCNLFTMARPGEGLAARFLDTLRAQAEVTRQALGPNPRFVRLAFGGGTPSQLDVDGMRALFDVATDVMGADPHAIPVACELSPETIAGHPEKLALLRERGVDRVSIGVQSFLESETRALRRPQTRETARAALAALRETGFPVLNLDLIYGIPGQTPETWRRSLDEALDFAPEELFLYPLYVRPGTGLSRSRREASDDTRRALYRQGRDLLLERGYEQHSMRMFRRADAPAGAAPAYTCQQDGMVGLGVGARSYTDGLHYSTEWAVGRRGVVALIDEWVGRDAARFATIDHGFRLDAGERRRRDVILSVLNREGLDRGRYRARFGTDALADLPQLAELLEHGLVREQGHALVPTARGLELSDAIGPWLYSEPVRARMQAYETT